MKPDTGVDREGYLISEEELSRLQETETELIGEVARICKKRGIHFCMVGGTMLGAVRHKGFIPWDDDADIGFLRGEYEKFREACRTELDTDRYYFQDFRDTYGYRRGYGKLRRKGTRFVRLGQEGSPHEQGIFIDLMPFDPVPDNPLERRLHFLKCFIYRKLLWSAMGKEAEKNPFIRGLYRLLSLIPEERLKASFEAFIKKNPGRRTGLVRILTFPTPKGCFGYKRQWYTELSLYPFGRLRLPGARDYDGYLRAKYGEYMEMPPAGKRTVHPVSSLGFADSAG